MEWGIVRKQFVEPVRVLKWTYHERAKEHYKNLGKNHEVTLDFLKNVKQLDIGFDEFQPILNNLTYWSEDE